MQTQRIEADVSEEDHDREILSFMLTDSPWPWSVEELSRELRDRIAAEDAVRRLTETGLIHRLGEFVFPTRAARRAHDISIGTA